MELRMNVMMLSQARSFRYIVKARFPSRNRFNKSAKLWVINIRG
jgi:hypothetical protein